MPGGKRDEPMFAYGILQLTKRKTPGVLARRSTENASTKRLWDSKIWKISWLDIGRNGPAPKVSLNGTDMDKSAG